MFSTISYSRVYPANLLFCADIGTFQSSRKKTFILCWHRKRGPSLILNILQTGIECVVFVIHDVNVWIIETVLPRKTTRSVTFKWQRPLATIVNMTGANSGDVFTFQQWFVMVLDSTTKIYCPRKETVQTALCQISIQPVEVVHWHTYDLPVYLDELHFSNTTWDDEGTNDERKNQCVALWKSHSAAEWWGGG